MDADHKEDSERLRKDTEILNEAGEKSQGRESLIRSLLPSGMIYQLVVKRDGTRKFTYLSDSVKQIHGITPEEGMADATLVYNAVHEDDVALLKKAENEAFKTLSNFKVEIRVKERSGKIRWSYIASTPSLMKDGSTCWDGIELDITEHTRTEEALRQKTALFEAQLNSSIEGVLVVDEQGKKVIQNQRTIDLWKIPKHIADNDDDQMQVQHVMHMTKNPEKFVEKVVYLYSHPDETSRDEVELTDGTVLDRYSAPVLGKDGKNYGRIWAFRDITERRRAAEERERLISELQQALSKVKTLSGLLPICSSCKKVRDDNGYWNQIEVYVRAHSEAEFTHGLCPDCAKKLYPEYYKNTYKDK
jgi:PAS domain S-box-containing protein